jgi:hypothetical protein
MIGDLWSKPTDQGSECFLGFGQFCGGPVPFDFENLQFAACGFGPVVDFHRLCQAVIPPRLVKCAFRKDDFGFIVRNRRGGRFNLLLSGDDLIEFDFVFIHGVDAFGRRTDSTWLIDISRKRIVTLI